MSAGAEELRQKIARLRDEALGDLERAADTAALEAVVVRDLSRKGRLAALFTELAAAAPDERRALEQNH